MIEWAWGVSRIIDGLYETADQNKVDLKHIGVTGCSYQGKMALYAGAFDERIALVMPQESGGGGEASWRFMATQSGTEYLEAAQGTAWYAENLKQFENADAPKLPFDMHELVAMVAPRAILAIANTGIDRRGSEAGSVSMRAAAEVYEALGISDRIGFTQTRPISEQPDGGRAGLRGQVPTRQDEREHGHRQDSVHDGSREVGDLDHAGTEVVADVRCEEAPFVEPRELWRPGRKCAPTTRARHTAELAVVQLCGVRPTVAELQQDA